MASTSFGVLTRKTMANTVMATAAAREPRETFFVRKATTRKVAMMQRKTRQSIIRPRAAPTEMPLPPLKL